MEYYNVIKEKIRSGEYSTVRRFSRSEVYNVFFDIEDEKGALIKDAVICSKCKNVYKRSTQCTSNLLRHQCYKLYRKKRDENDMELEPREETTMEMLLNPKSAAALKPVSMSPVNDEPEPTVINAAKKPRITLVATPPPPPPQQPQPQPEPVKVVEPTPPPPPPVPAPAPAPPSNPNERDESHVFAEGWAIMYRKLTTEQRIFAKRLIDETLMHGQLGQLTMSTSLNQDPISISRNRFPIQHQVKEDEYIDDGSYSET
ncbi:formin-like protein 3 [Musca domestica]|uniref:Formin-like protein 3 n=1 Tax=Musca domestica TaxID=7370 RepID=A0A9J7I241_MUSDO|nr:formin-like protein 3 [Musca domestica]